MFSLLLRNRNAWESISLKNDEKISNNQILFLFFLSYGRSRVCSSRRKQQNEKLSDSSKQIEMGVNEPGRKNHLFFCFFIFLRFGGFFNCVHF